MAELMTHEFALENIKEAFQAQTSDEAIKTIINRFFIKEMRHGQTIREQSDHC
jgi:hypothetical protein